METTRKGHLRQVLCKMKIHQTAVWGICAKPCAGVYATTHDKLKHIGHETTYERW
jgi:hypothetical protein